MMKVSRQPKMERREKFTILTFNTVFLMILKRGRDRDRRMTKFSERPSKNERP
jgi:hypothetical protein